MRILTLHRRKKVTTSEIAAASEILVVGRINPKMQKQIVLAKLLNIPVRYERR